MFPRGKQAELVINVETGSDHQERAERQMGSQLLVNDPLDVENIPRALVQTE
jgi:hypothetical protein